MEEPGMGIGKQFHGCVCCLKGALSSKQALGHPVAGRNVQDLWVTGAAQQRFADNSLATHMPRFRHRPSIATGLDARLGFPTRAAPHRPQGPQVARRSPKPQ